MKRLLLLCAIAPTLLSATPDQKELLIDIYQKCFSKNESCAEFVKTVTITVSEKTTIAQIKEQIASEERVPAKQQKGIELFVMSCGKHKLENNRSCGYYDLTADGYAPLNLYLPATYTAREFKRRLTLPLRNRLASLMLWV